MYDKKDLKMNFIKFIPVDEFKYICEEYYVDDTQRYKYLAKRKPTLKLEEQKSYKTFNQHREAYEIKQCYKVVLQIPNFIALDKEGKTEEAEAVINELNRGIAHYLVDTNSYVLTIDSDKIEKLINNAIAENFVDTKDIIERNLNIYNINVFADSDLTFDMGYVYIKGDEIDVNPDPKTLEKHNKRETQKKMFNTFCKDTLEKVLHEYGLYLEQDRIGIYSKSSIIDKLLKEHVEKCFKELANIGITIDTKLKEDDINFSISTERTRYNTVGKINYKLNFKENENA